MTDPLLLEMAERVFSTTCTHAAIQDAEREGWAPAVWSRVTEAGLHLLSVPEAAGGAGGSLGDALQILRLAGRHAAPIPLAENGLLAGWLLSGSGLGLGEGLATVVPGRPEDSLSLSGHALSGTAHRVPWGRSADRITLLVEREGAWLVAAVPSAAARVETMTNLAGEPRDSLTFVGAVAELAPAAPGVDPDALRLRGALTRVMLMAGALERMSRLTLDYTSERVQFGRPVARFQTVQQHLVSVAQDVALVLMAAEQAALAAARGPAGFEIAAAKLLANRASHSATRGAHQAHGAMGMTQEYPLHQLSRRLWAWRTEYGDDQYWSQRLGGAVAQAGADLLYPAITGGSQVVRV
jgi:acyl-CoA dehydrogenase